MTQVATWRDSVALFHEDLGHLCCTLTFGHFVQPILSRRWLIHRCRVVRDTLWCSFYQELTTKNWMHQSQPAILVLHLYFRHMCPVRTDYSCCRRPCWMMLSFKSSPVACYQVVLLVRRMWITQLWRLGNNLVYRKKTVMCKSELLVRLSLQHS